MRNRAALCVLLLAGTLVTCVLAPGIGLGGQLHALTSVSVAEAAVGRGDGGGGGGGTASQVSNRTADLIIGGIIPVFFVFVGCALAVFMVQRNAGAAVGALVFSFVVGAFFMAPDQVESFFRSSYQAIF